MQKILPHTITSYDLLKSFAVITMIIDHIGYYFFPEQLEWRFATHSMPIWMFLIGYSSNRSIPKQLWAGAFILILGNFIVGMPIFSLNILFGIIVVRLTIDHVVPRIISTKISMLFSMIIMTLLFLPTNALIEYGTLCYMFAIFGYVVKNQNFTENGLTFYILFIISIYLISIKIIFGVNQTQFYTTMVIVTTVIWFLQYFKPKECTALHEKLPNFLSTVIKFTGRNTLYIYVGHLMLFKIIALFIMSERYQFLDFRLF